MERLVTITVIACISVSFFVIGVPVLAAATEADVQELLQVIERHETRGNCTSRPPGETNTARGCYQMTRLALADVEFKDGEGNWLPNPFRITSDEQFERHRPANEYAVRRLAAINWSRLTCATRFAACHTGSNISIDPSSLLSAAHFLGAHGLNNFVKCGLGPECLSDTVVKANGNDRARIHSRLIDRMTEAAGLDIAELTVDERRDCNRSGHCGAGP